MTSKISFIDILTEDLKRRIWPLALSITGFFFALPVLALIKIEDHLNSLKMGYDILQSLQVSFTQYTIGNNNYFAITGLFIMAGLNALTGMKYLHSRQETDFYGSIPMLRTARFLAAYINGILIAIVPFIFMHALTAVFGYANKLVSVSGLICGAETVILEVTGFILLYSFIVLATILTGHSAVSISGALVLLFAPWFYYAVLTGYARAFFVTLYDTYDKVLWYLSPATFFFNIIKGRSISYTAYNLLMALIALAVSALILALNLYLIKIRPAEAATKAMAFEKTRPVIKILILVPVILSCGSFFESVTTTNDYAWLAFGLIAGLILGHSAIEIVYEFDFKACLRHIPSGLIAAVIATLVALFFVFDVPGYDTKLPREESIESGAVYVPGINSGAYYYDQYSYEDDTYDVQGSKEMEGMMITDTADLYTLAKAGTVWADKNRWHGNDNASDPENLTEGSEDYTQISIYLRKPSGRVFKRNYFVDLKDPENYAALRRIYDTEEYKKNTYDIYHMNETDYASRAQLLTYDTGVYSDNTSTLTEAKIRGLIDTMKKDTSGLTLDYIAKEAPIGEVSINVLDEESLYAGSTYTVPLGYVYPSFTETLSLLKEYGVFVNREVTAADIDFIKKTIWNEDYTSEETETITAAGEISKLFPDLVNQAYYTVNYALLSVSDTVDYEVHFNQRLFTGLKNIDDYEARFVQFYYMKKSDAGEKQ